MERNLEPEYSDQRKSRTNARENQRNLAKLLKQRLPAGVLKSIRKIGNFAQEKGFSAYIVGGFLRDVLLGVENLDLDIIIEGDAITFVKLLKEKIALDMVTHRRFGTATITLPDGFKIDLASARKEHYAYPAVLPTVTFSSIREDLIRRDFTINALAVKINRNNFGQLLDLFEGQKDLTERKVRILHDRSFIDDPTRIFRAIRFEQRYNFKIEEQTLKLMREALASGMLERLTRSRLGREFILLLKEAKPLKAISRFDQLCGLQVIHPLIRLDKMLQVKKNLPFGQRLEQIFLDPEAEGRRISSGNIISYAIKQKLPKPQDNWLVYFVLLTKRLNDQQLEKLCCDFSLTRKDKQKLKTLRTKEIA